MARGWGILFFLLGKFKFIHVIISVVKEGFPSMEVDMDIELLVNLFNLHNKDDKRVKLEAQNIDFW